MTPRPSPPAGRAAGFTLIEVLIALTIVGVALAAFARMTGQTAANAGYLAESSLAMLSADNALAELRIGTLPAPGVRVLDCPQGDLPLVCRVEILAAPQALRDVAVDVYDGRERNRRLAHLTTRLPEPRS
ncbi:type II secretion system minor pseudopilin GspI [Paludibacterium paludis]|uniref:Type II secretion system protein I n=1 Tax=Paludibacterium paludis TaxID=1225769 RepID=A0A918NXR0_9NEIS|nr:type II secretion system minor pseudopilin GspI [Paludibacterium paludis]GGY04336.1 type II secretion system protein GspI [Paludibacterium paludis]